jgi:uncharacterized protein
VAIEFDPKKDEINFAKHGISLARAADMEILELVGDRRFDYGEIRFRAFSYIDGLAYCFCFADMEGKRRAISLRRAHLKEMKRHVEDHKRLN